MNPERWQKIDQIFHSAINLEGADREAFLDQACGADESLHRAVESLIEHHERAGSFIESPAFGEPGALPAEESESREGQTVGHYYIRERLGEGGMGEVYLAQDTKLGRDVALKFLPGFYTKNSVRLRRFEQEARAASALNHPNILTIHETGEEDSVRFLVTEFIEGETLRQRLSGASLELSEILSIAMQTADALAAAHEADLIHRDIKPENIMLR